MKPDQQRTGTSLTYDQLPVHQLEVFWAGLDRYESLRSAYTLLRQALGPTKKVTWFRERIAAEVPSALMIPTPRTLKRFGNPANPTSRPMQENPLYLSGLLLACNSIYIEHRSDPSFANLDLGGFLKLAELHKQTAPTLSGEQLFAGPVRESNEYSRAELQLIYDSIVSPSEDNPQFPEFPAFSPRFPATPMDEHDFFSHRVFIKDESYNPTGSHKDRWALEMVYEYKRKIGNVLKGKGDHLKLRAPSMISSGSGALALQHQLRLWRLPNLRVIMADNRPNDPVAARLRAFGAIVTKYDLDSREISDKEVLAISDNVDGFDVTTRNLEDPHRRNFYDWLCYEILAIGVRYIFVPVGTGDLFANIICVIDDEVSGRKNDPRLKGATVKEITVFGATTRNEKSQMDKLYAKYRPTLREVGELLTDFKAKETIGVDSGIIDVGEDSVEKAYSWAKTNQIRTEHSGIAGLGLFYEMREKIAPEARVAVVNTGWMFLPR